MRKFSYKEITYPLPAGLNKLMEGLNKLGSEGWELVSVCPSDSNESGLSRITAFMKKETKQ